MLSLVKELTTSVAHTAQEAIKLADTSSPKIVVVELLMPKHNGLEFIHEFRSYGDWIDIPMIIYSQISADEVGLTDEIKKDMGVVEHFYKPRVSLETLVKTAEDALR